jgi:hypothetical protein
LKVLIDHNLSPALAISLNAFFESEGVSFTALRSKFPADTTDTDLFNALGREGSWVVMTGDRNILKNKLEVEAIASSGVVVVFFEKSFLSLEPRNQAAKIISNWPNIYQELYRARPGHCFVMGANGKLTKK